ncbi:MAG: HAD family hydrolase [Phycisphaeraceae bacterium]|nr:HAD family hydrolase [Phycisphaeraceae bacterium]
MSGARPRVGLVVFDLGGVIVRICRSWAEACQAAGVPVRGTEDFGTPEMVAARRELAGAYQMGRIQTDEFFPRIAAATGGHYTAEEVRRVHDAWTLDEYPGVGELIIALKRAGVPTGVLSNTNHAHWVRLAPPAHEPATEYPTPRMVDHLHASHLLGLAKPDRIIYEEFERRVRAAGWTGRTDQIVFFDDLVENIDAARQSGWDGEVIDHLGDTAAQMVGHLARRGVVL